MCCRAAVGVAPLVVLVTASGRDADSLSPGATARCRMTNCSHVFAADLFPYLLLFLGTSYGGFLEMNRGSFRLGLTLKTPLERNSS